MARNKDKGRGWFAWARSAFADRSRVLDTATSVVTFAIVVTVLATLVIARGPLQKQATSLRTSRLQVAFDWPPLAGKATSRSHGSGEPATWMNRQMRAELENLALKLLNGDPFDSHALERTRDALRQTGWFADGPWLKRHPSGLVVISGRWRAPVAAVRWEQKDRLVSAGGELLTPEYPLGRSGLKTIVSVGAAPPSLGEKWSGGVQAGLTLLNYLRSMPGFEQVESVDVGEYGSEKRLSILTRTGGRIVWGGAPGVFVPGQASAAARRDRLVAIMQSFGQLDAGRSVVDVRPEDGAYVQDDEYLARATTVPRR